LEPKTELTINLLRLVATCITLLYYLFVLELFSRTIKEYYYIIFVFLFAKHRTL